MTSSTPPAGVPDDLGAHIFDPAAHSDRPPGVPDDIVEHENDQAAFSSRPDGVSDDLDLAIGSSGTDVREHPGRHERDVVADDVVAAARRDVVDDDRRDRYADERRDVAGDERLDPRDHRHSDEQRHGDGPGSADDRRTHQ